MERARAPQQVAAALRLREPAVARDVEPQQAGPPPSGGSASASRLLRQQMILAARMARETVDLPVQQAGVVSALNFDPTGSR